MDTLEIIELWADTIPQQEKDQNRDPLPDDLGLAVQMLIYRLRKSGPIK